MRSAAAARSRSSSHWPAGGGGAHQGPGHAMGGPHGPYKGGGAYKAQQLQASATHFADAPGGDGVSGLPADAAAVNAQPARVVDLDPASSASASSTSASSSSPGSGSVRLRPFSSRPPRRGAATATPSVTHVSRPQPLRPL